MEELGQPPGFGEAAVRPAGPASCLTAATAADLVDAAQRGENGCKCPALETGPVLQKPAACSSILVVSSGRRCSLPIHPKLDPSAAQRIGNWQKHLAPLRERQVSRPAGLIFCPLAKKPHGAIAADCRRAGSASRLSPAEPSFAAVSGFGVLVAGAALAMLRATWPQGQPKLFYRPLPPGPAFDQWRGRRRPQAAINTASESSRAPRMCRGQPGNC